jgi:hypothetical protein
VGLSQRVDATFPNGIFLEQFKPFADTIGADVVLVPNLETAAVADQVAWFSRLASEGIVPTHIELGNEFWIAMGGDPNVEAKWPDEPTSMAIMRRYLDALRPYLPPGTRAAVQAAPGAFMFLPSNPGAFYGRLRQWNDDLAPASWFDAVTTHLYSRLDQVTGDPDANAEPVTPVTVQRNYPVMVAHYDDGTDSALADLENRLPGKEIWITEWNAQGQSSWQPGQTHPITPPMQLQIVTRMELACLRHASVTTSLYFSLNFLTNTAPYDFVPDGSGGFLPVPTTVALGWFFEAANGGATFQRLVEPTAPRISGGGALPETYADIEAATFIGADRVTMIVQNAGPGARSIDLTTVEGAAVPSEIDQLAAPDLADTTLRPAVVATLTPTQVVTLPAYSVTRVIWDTEARIARKHLRRVSSAP